MSPTHHSPPHTTQVGWFRGSASPEDKRYLCEYMRTNGEDVAWDFIRTGMNSVAGTCIMMMQVGACVEEEVWM